MMATIGVSTVTASLAGVLFAIYARLYRRVPVPFTLSLAIFALLFLGQNLLAVFSFVLTLPIIPETLAPLLLGTSLLECGGLLVMVRMSSA